MLHLENFGTIWEIQDIDDVDITRLGQHDFKKRRGTSTLLVEIQSLITHALDGNELGLVASFKFSAGFDIVNIDLLLKRFKKLVFGMMSET
jgi:hypothetical protein